MLTSFTMNVIKFKPFDSEKLVEIPNDKLLPDTFLGDLTFAFNGNYPDDGLPVGINLRGLEMIKKYLLTNSWDNPYDKKNKIIIQNVQGTFESYVLEYLGLSINNIDCDDEGEQNDFIENYDEYEEEQDFYLEDDDLFSDLEF